MGDWSATRGHGHRAGGRRRRIEYFRADYIRQLTAITPFGGETCAPPDPARARNSCADILREGAEYHVSYLGEDYYTPTFHDTWAAQGCLGTVRTRLGYCVGTALAGGRGRIIGTLIGSVILGVLSTGLILMNVPFFTQLLIKGVVIILAVAIDSLKQRTFSFRLPWFSRSAPPRS